MTAARWRLASLWLSQTVRFTADNCLRAFVIVTVAHTGQAGKDAAWHLVTVLLMIPAVVLAPVNGALANALPKRWTLAGSAAFCLAVTALFAALDGFWLVCWALVALGTAVYSPTRYALLPSAADDTGLPLTRINGWIETGAVCAVVGGLALGGVLTGEAGLGRDAAVAAAVVLNAVGLVSALPVWFASDVRRRESPARALADFFRDCRRICRDREAGGSLAALAALHGILTAAIGAFVAGLFTTTEWSTEELLTRGLWLAGGIALGSLLAGAQRHQRRALGLVPLGVAGLVIGLTSVAASGSFPSSWMCGLLGLAAGMVNVPLAAKYQATVPADARGNALAIKNAAEYLSIAMIAGVLTALAYAEMLGSAGQFWLLAGLAIPGAAAAWYWLGRNILEQLLEWAIWPCYRIRGHGPGFVHFPARGPVLVVSNHTGWFDPIWLGKVIPRKMTPMMTSAFYDLPVLHWLMKNLVGAIRVQAATFRREAPELGEAIQVLDKGGCVVLFPEGACRRSEERPLRPFGQGVWHILHERPETPVVVCWIEGGWGSYWSYAGGPPTRNKRMDWWRHIAIAAGEPEVLKPDVLANHRETRNYLRRLCAQTRRILGLPEVALDTPDEDQTETGRPGREGVSESGDGPGQP
jgi:1-acyl-sn-glycerol-3-phosphate acyltransferase